MYDPYFSTNNAFDPGDITRFDDIQFFSNYTAILAVLEKNTQTRYVDESNGNEYRWNGTTFILMNSGSGSVGSVTSGTAQTLSISGTTNAVVSTITNTVNGLLKLNASNAIPDNYVRDTSVFRFALVKTSTRFFPALNFYQNASVWGFSAGNVSDFVRFGVAFDNSTFLPTLPVDTIITVSSRANPTQYTKGKIASLSFPPDSNNYLEFTMVIDTPFTFSDGTQVNVNINLPSSGGTVLSVTAGSPSIVIGGTPSINPTVDTVQNIQSTATPTFNELALTTTTPSANNRAASKLYTDTTLCTLPANATGIVANNSLIFNGTTFAPANVVSTIAAGSSAIVIGGTTLNRTIDTGTVPINRGGTALTTAPANGQVLIGNGTAYTLATIAGTTNNISVTNGAGTITLSIPAILALTSASQQFNLTGATSTMAFSGTTTTFSNASQNTTYSGLNAQINLTGSNALVTGGGVNRNQLRDADLQSLRVSSSISPSSVAFDSFGSMTITYATIPDAWSTLNPIIPRYAFSPLRENSPRIPFFAVQMTGTGWNVGNSCNKIWIGFMMQETLSRVRNWGTTDFIIGHDIVWNTANTSVEKGIMARFSLDGTHIVNFVYGTNNIGTRTGNTTTSTFIVNDVLLFYLNTNLNFTIEWRDSSAAFAVKSTGTIAHPDGVSTFVNNFNCGRIVPVISTNLKGSTFGIKVLSARNCANLGITLAGGENIFY